MANFLERNWSTILLLLGGYYAYSQMVIRGREAISPITKPVSLALAKIQFAINGSDYITRSWAGFYLNPDKLDYSYKVKDMQWLKAVTMLHDDNEALLNRIFDSNLRVKHEYQVLVGYEVNADAIATVDKE